MCRVVSLSPPLSPSATNFYNRRPGRSLSCGVERAVSHSERVGLDGHRDRRGRDRYWRRVVQHMGESRVHHVAHVSALVLAELR